jgi:hypothetical protein
MSTRIQSAPGVRGCCDPAGRLCALALKPLPREQLVMIALARGEGTRDAIEMRIDDLLAAGLLIDIEDEG